MMPAMSNRKKRRGPLTPKKRVPIGSGFHGGDGVPDQFYGFDRERPDGVSVWEDDAEPVCVVAQVRVEDAASLREQGIDAEPGQWLLSSGGCDLPQGVTYDGAFATAQAAFDRGAERYGVVRWMSPPSTN